MQPLTLKTLILMLKLVKTLNGEGPRKQCKVGGWIPVGLSLEQLRRCICVSVWGAVLICRVLRC